MRRVAAVLCGVALGCAELPPIPTNTCGNSVVERGEDCDTFPSPEHLGKRLRAGETLSCGKADDTLRACAYVCDTLLADQQVAGCPDGWVCGRDQTCRVPAQSFDLGSFETLDRTPDDVVFQDFDGDGFGDLGLFDGGDVTIRYGGAGGRFGEGLRESVGLIGLSRSFGFGPAVGDIDGDGAVDIVAPTEDGVVALMGSRDKTLKAASYPLGRVPLSRSAVETSDLVQLAIPGEPGPGFIAFLGGGNGSQLTIGDIRAPDDTNMMIDPRNLVITAAPGGPHVSAKGDLDGDGGDELVVGFPGTRVILVFRALPRAAGALGFVRHVGTIDVGPGNTLGDRIALARVDGDATLDVVAEIITASGGIHLGWARGACAPECGFGAPERLTAANVHLQDVAGEGILAMADMNKDGLVDFAVSGVRHTTDPIFGPVGSAIVSRVSGAQVTYDLVSVARGGWIEAVIGDFNKDGNGDIAATSSVAGGVDVFLGSSLNLFNRGRVETTHTPKFLSTGDFDGDFVTDLALFEPVEDTVKWRLAVAFGRLQGVPAPPRVMAEVSSPQSAIPVYARGVDLITDLLVVSAVLAPFDPQAARLDVYLFGGSTDQRLRAALDLASDRKVAPLGGLLLGRFERTEDGSQKRGLDLVAVTLPTVNAQNMPVPSEAFLIRSEFLAGRTELSTGPERITSAACDVRFSSLDKLRCTYSTVLTIPEADQLLGPLGEPGDVALRFGCKDATDGVDANKLRVQIFRPALAMEQRACNQAEVPSLGLDEVSRAEITEIDGDDRPDLLLVHGANPGSGTSGVSIHWRAHVSGSAASIDLREGAVGSTTIHSPSVPIEDAALADLDLDGRLDVLVLTPYGLLVARQSAAHVFAAFEPVGSEGRGGMGGGPVPVTSPPLGEPSQPPLPPDPRIQIAGAARLFARDIDGDAIVDAIVVRGKTVATYLGQAVPRGGFEVSVEPVLPVDGPEVMR